MRRQRGQILPLFALMFFFLIGVVALAVDYGFLTDQHRNLQAYADQSAEAGAHALNANALSTDGNAAAAAARQAAFRYLRELVTNDNPDNLHQSNLSDPCWSSGSPAPTTFSSNVPANGSGSPCPLPGASYANYSVAICVPAETISTGTPCATTSGRPNTISMRIVESTATAMAGIFGTTSVTLGGFAAAENVPNFSTGATTYSSQVPLGLYSAGCLTVSGTHSELVDGDVYVDSCGVTVSGVSAGLCVQSTAATAGNVTSGPLAPNPAGSGSTACTAASTGVNAGGSVVHAPVGTSMPRLQPPPGYTTTVLTPAAPSATNGCLNGTHNSVPATPSNCFNPGVYTSLTGIQNNLNPGVYYILGNEASCGGVFGAGCEGVSFSGDTMNANNADVAGTCWTLACNTGFRIDPTAAPVSDPECQPAGGTCPVNGFTNVPSAVGQNFGVTFVLLGRADFCLLDGCLNTSRTVLLSPFCTSGAGCVPQTAGPSANLNDGAFTIYGPTTGVIQVPSNSRFGGVGTVYAPNANLQVAGGTFELIPGQAIVGQAGLQTGNPAAVPDIFFPCCTSLGLSGTATLPGALLVPGVHLIR